MSFSAQSPPPPPLPGPMPGSRAGLEYLRTYHYIFENPQWTTTILWGFLMSFVPIAGPLVLFGYLFFVVDSLLESKGTRYPVFDVNRFVDYLLRGLWPVLAAIAVSFVLVPIFFVLWLAAFIIPMAIAGVGGEEAAPIAGAVMILLTAVMMIVIIALSLGLNILTVPLILRAGLSQDFVEAFKFDWIKDFARKMWLETLLGLLFLSLTGFVVSMIGFAACCIGVYAAQVVVLLAYAHLLYQLYSLYLTRGGIPVYPKPKPTTPT